MLQSRAGSSSSPETMLTGGLGAYISQKACFLPRQRPEDTSPGLVCTADAGRPTTHSERDKSGPRHVPDGNQELRPHVRRHKATRTVCRHHPATAGHAGFHHLQNWDRVPTSGSGQAGDLRAAARAPVSHKTWETRVEG